MNILDLSTLHKVATNEPFYLVYGRKVYPDEYLRPVYFTQSCDKCNDPLSLDYGRKVYYDEYLRPVYFAQVGTGLMFLYP